MNSLDILPLAITVILGPQILVAMLLLTHKEALNRSIIYIISVMTTLVLTTLLYYFLIDSFDLHLHQTSGKHTIKHLLGFVFIFLMIKTIVNRKRITESPKWMKRVSTASTFHTALFGLLLIAIMPTDIAIEIAVANTLNEAKLSFMNAIPFFTVVLFLISIPLITFLILGKKGPVLMERANKWLNSHGWVISFVVYGFFVYLLLS